MTRALLTMDMAACLKADGDVGMAASTAAEAFAELPDSYRTGLVRSRATALHRQLSGRPRDQLGQALTA